MAGYKLRIEKKKVLFIHNKEAIRLIGYVGEGVRGDRVAIVVVVVRTVAGMKKKKMLPFNSVCV